MSAWSCHSWRTRRHVLGQIDGWRENPHHNGPVFQVCQIDELLANQQNKLNFIAQQAPPRVGLSRMTVEGSAVIDLVMLRTSRPPSRIGKLAVRRGVPCLRSRRTLEPVISPSTTKHALRRPEPRGRPAAGCRRGAGRDSTPVPATPPPDRSDPQAHGRAPGAFVRARILYGDIALVPLASGLPAPGSSVRHVTLTASPGIPPATAQTQWWRCSRQRRGHLAAAWASTGEPVPAPWACTGQLR